MDHLDFPIRLTPRLPNMRLSRMRVWVSGRTVETYRYSQPYGFNYAPERRDGGTDWGQNETRRDDNLARARAGLRRLVAANEDIWGELPKFVTYTFAANVTDLKAAKVRWRQYTRRLRATYGSRKYVCVAEFQKRGAVHFHALHFDLPYVPKAGDHLGALWRQGNVKVIALRKVACVAAYVSKYLDGEMQDKRLAGAKAYFGSRGLRRPYQLRTEGACDEFLSSVTLKEETRQTFLTDAAGLVDYTRSKKIDASDSRASTTSQGRGPRLHGPRGQARQVRRGGHL